jgi:general secretion pathway protein J
MKSPLHQHRGFTLLEVLIALSIFSLIGLAAYRMLDIVILSQSKVEVHQNKIRSLERAMHIIGADFGQLVNRPVRDNYGDQLKALANGEENYLIEFTRQGWRNPLQLPRSQLQRVAYELGNISKDLNTTNQQSDSGVHLLRHYWPMLDRNQESEPQTQVLLTNINDLQLRFMDQQGEWQSQWPVKPLIGEPTKALPKALMLKLDSSSLGQIERIYQLSEYSAELIKPATNNSQSGTTPPIQSDPVNNSGGKP